MAIESGAQQGFFGQWHSLQGDTLSPRLHLVRGGLQLRQPNRHGCSPKNWSSTWVKSHYEVKLQLSFTL